MPNEPVGQFPTPPGATPMEPIEPRAPEEVKLTDEVAPDLTVPTMATPPVIQTRQLEQREIPSHDGTEPEPSPPVYTPPTTPPPITPTPATLPPTTGGHFPVISLLLLLIAIGAIAATYFFYQQTQVLTTQLTEVERTLERRRIEEGQITVTPTLSPTEEITLTPTVTGTTPTLTISPTSGVTTDSHLVFADIKNVIATAQKSYSNAQLLMIVATGVETKDTTITKYWFRQTPTDKKYLYILTEPGKPNSLVDQNVFLTPDNNIPSLNQLAQSGGLGIDLAEVLSISSAACPTTFDCANTPISAQYIKANTTLWQVSYKPTDGSKPFVVQIDSITKRILFKSL